ncbi:taste receptor type 1 member 2 [Hemicordylus capensis]|uniref:taste receptor type 1 member 2 n=1 Tax=Hemicordylus capensis TaxID=884348 RepID=UPI0023045A93|nr:taste receptor type 1 member 2 [Hemicordylus capensis]
MRFAVAEINNSSCLLPGVSLGYEMVDVCYLTNTIHPVLYFLSDEHFRITIERNYTHYRPRVLAVIGPDSSPAAVSMAYILSQFLVPQITYSATTEALSNPKVFPAAFRTIPSTEQQIAVMLRLLRRFRWNWVIVVCSDDDYGQQNWQLLRSQASWACIAFQETIPVTRAKQDSRPFKERLEDIVAKIAQSSAKVVLVLTLELPLQSFFQEVIRQNVTELVWIASEAWAIDPDLHNMAGISSVGTIMGVAAQNTPIPGLNEFRTRLPSGSTEGPETPAASPTCNQVCDQCLAVARLYDENIRGTGDRIDFNVYSAVYVVAHALHRLLGCTNMGCHKRTVYPWQLLKEVGRVNFTLLDTTINFDEKGDPPNGFEVIQWQWDVPGLPFKKIATYNSLLGQLHVYDKEIVWRTENNTAPVSICSEQCGPGEKKKLNGQSTCCFQCVKCEAGTFLNKSDNFTCQNCPLDMWSKDGQEKCFMRLVTYLHWKDPVAVALILCSVLGVLVTLGILATFARHSDTPVVKSAGGSLCFLMIASLLVGFCSIPFYIGMPTELKCICRQTVFSICFTVCISCITVRSFQIICAFKMATQLPRAYDAWMKYNGQRVFIATVSLAKVIIVVVNITSHQPAPVEPMVSSDPATLILICNRSYRSAMVVNNAFDMILSFFCFVFAYMGKALPKNYNEAKNTTLCMTCYFISWVSLFLVISFFEGLVVTVFDAAIVLFNLFSISLGYFGLRCYVIFFHPERNTAAFFQTAIQSYTMRQD